MLLSVVIICHIGISFYRYRFTCFTYIRLFGDDYFSFNLAQTYTDTLSSRFDITDANRVLLLWERRTYNNFAYQFAVEHAGKDYFPPADSSYVKISQDTLTSSPTVGHLRGIRFFRDIGWQSQRMYTHATPTALWKLWISVHPGAVH